MAASSALRRRWIRGCMLIPMAGGRAKLRRPPPAQSRHVLHRCACPPARPAAVPARRTGHAPRGGDRAGRRIRACAVHRRRGGRIAVEALPDRGFHRNHGCFRCVVLRRRDQDPVFVQQERHLEYVFDARHRRRLDRDHQVDRRQQLRGGLLPRRRPRAGHPRPGWQRAQPPLRHRCRRQGARPDARREGEGRLRRLQPRRQTFLRDQQRARPEVLRPLPLRRQNLRPRTRVPERHGLRCRPGPRRCPLAGARQARHHQRLRPVRRRPARRQGHEGLRTRRRGQLRGPALRARLAVAVLHRQLGWWRSTRTAAPRSS